MSKILTVVAVVVCVLSLPLWATPVLYDGSTDIATFGWKTWEGGFQGSTDGSVWHLNDSGGAKTKLKYGDSGVAVDENAGAYIESRMKCVSISDASTPLNLGLWITGGVNVRREMTVRPEKLVMDSKEYAGTFSDYRVIRMCYKYLNRPNFGRQHSWAVYLDGSDVPVLWTPNSSGSPAFGGPTWGAGNTGTAQDLYFDYVNYNDGAYVCPEMDGSVAFVNNDPDGTATPTSFTITWSTNTPTDGKLYWKDSSGASYTMTPDPANPTRSTTHSVTVDGVTAGFTYIYYAVSTDASGKKVVSLPASLTIPNPFSISSGPALTVNSATSATVTWETSIADEVSEVHYGRSTAANEWVVVESPEGGKTSHSITFSPPPGNLIYYYVKSSRSPYPAVQSAVGHFSTSLAGDEYLDNVNFELLSGAPTSISPWVKFGNFDGIKTAFQDGFLPEFNWCVGTIATFSTSRNKGGIYQQVPTTAGQYYEASADIWTRRQAGPAYDGATHYLIGATPNPSHPLDAACRVGIDPFGGTDPNSPAISWSAWTETSKSANDNEGCLTQNPYFEGTFGGDGVANSWTAWQTAEGNAVQFSQTLEEPSYMGSHQKWGRNDNLAFTAGICQSVPVRANWAHTFGGLVRYTKTAANSCSVGYDTTGQTTDPNAGTIVWKSLDADTADTNGWRVWNIYNIWSPNTSISLWCKFSQNGTGDPATPCFIEADDLTMIPAYQGGPWEPVKASVRAAGPMATVFLQQQHLWSINWVQTGFDNTGWAPVDEPSANDIASIKRLPDGHAVSFSGRVVTAAWTNDFYLEESDRSSGLRVVVPIDMGVTMPAMGTSPQISGFTATAQTGEKYVVATYITPGDPASIPDPLGMTNKAVSSSNNGLLVKVCGRASADMGQSMDGSFYFTIEDGSLVDGYHIPGLKVNTSGYLPWIDDYVAITGISELEYIDPTPGIPGDERVIRVLRMRTDDDAVTLQRP